MEEAFDSMVRATAPLFGGGATLRSIPDTSDRLMALRIASGSAPMPPSPTSESFPRSGRCVAYGQLLEFEEGGYTVESYNASFVPEAEWASTRVFLGGPQ